MQTREDTPDTQLLDTSSNEKKGISQEYAIITQKEISMAELEKVNNIPSCDQMEEYPMDLMCKESSADEFHISLAELKKVDAVPSYDQMEECPIDLMCNESTADDTEFFEYDDTDHESENMSESELKYDDKRFLISHPDKSFLISYTPTSIDVFSRLSDEIILQIFKFLPRWFLINCALVCKRWNKLSHDMSLWRKYDMGSRVVKSGVLEDLLSRGVVVLRLTNSEIKYPIFCPDFLNNRRLSALQYLDLSMVSVSPEGLAEILFVCIHLKKLSLESCLVNDNCLRCISDNEKLSVLNLTMCRGITGSGLYAIFTKCIKLTELNLSWIELNHKDWVSILPFIPESIQRLNVSGHKKSFNDECLLQVVNRCRNLTELDISDCRDISGNLFEELIKNCKELEHFHASRSFRIPSESYRLLKSLPNFKYLDIFNTLRDEALNYLREYLPHVQVNKHVFSTIARPTTGSQRFSIWGIRTKDGFD